MTYRLEPSPRSAKKWRVTTPWGKTVDFGATGYSDYTIHKDSSRQDNYLSRHASRENWTETGTDTAGFWSRWVLWNLPDFMGSVKDTESRFGISIDTSSVTQNSDGTPLNSTNLVTTTTNTTQPTMSLPIPSQPVNDPYFQYKTAIDNATPYERVIIYSNIGISSPARYDDLINYIPLLTRSTPPTIDQMTDYELLSLLPSKLQGKTNIYTTRKQLVDYVKSVQSGSNNSQIEQYNECLVTAEERKRKGSLKLCPQGYCTAKLTYDVYPSYWANLNASKICSGEKEDLEGNLENYYERY